MKVVRDMFDFNAIKVEPKVNVKFGAKKKRTVGILNKGRGNRFIKNRFSDLDVGIQDEGENTLLPDQGSFYKGGVKKWS